jgi:TPR repeat protein
VKATTPALNPVVWLALAVCLLTCAAYLPGLAGDYMFDDQPNLLDNPRLAMHTLSLQELAGAAFSSSSGLLRRPVSMASFALNRYFFGIAPYSFKVVNLCIHLLTGLGLWWLGSLLVRSYAHSRTPALTAGAQRWLPVLVAGLWLVHPLNLSTVLYIVQRMAGLTALFTVAGLGLYLTGRLRMQEGRSGLAHMLSGLLLCGGLAIFSKENGILLPVYMLVLELTLFRFRSGPVQRDRRVIVFFSVSLLVPAILCLALLILYPERLLSYAGRNFTLPERLLTEARVVVFYLKMIVTPSTRELGLYHDDIALSRGLLDPPATLYSILLLAGLLAGAAAMLRRNPLVSLGILWFFTGHLLESTILPLEIAHEHRNYLADYGILLAGSTLLLQGSLQRSWMFARIGVFASFLLLFSYTTWLRADQWSDNITQATYEARHHLQSPRAQFAAGRIHARLALQGVPGSADKAMEFLARASELDQADILPDVVLLKLRYYLGLRVDPAAFARIRHKLAAYPVSPSSISSLRALAECAKSRCAIPDEQMEQIFSTALAQRHSTILDSVYGFYRINKLEDFRGGLEILQRVANKSPHEPQNWINLVNLLLVMGRVDAADRQLDRMMKYELYGGNELTYDKLRKEINDARQQLNKPPASQHTASEEKAR